MRVLARLLLSLLLLLPLRAETQRFRQWLAGQESGGLVWTRSREGNLERLESREWIRLERMGTVIEQRVEQKAERRPDASFTVAWSIRLANQPMEGTASWSPRTPRQLRVRAAGQEARTLEVPEGALLWPGDLDARLREAARERKDLRLRTFSFPMQQWDELELKVQGPSPLPGFPDAVRFRGVHQEGTVRVEMESWISPTAGELRQASELMGIPVLLQRVELPTPETTPGPGFFERTLQGLPPHPLLPWVEEAVLAWEGPQAQALPEDDQQRRLGSGRYAVRAAAPPSTMEATQAPVAGTPSREETPFLAPSPLLQFRDPLFDGLVARLAPRPGASRWELAQAVTAFVFEWITRKDYGVGFATAREVARDAAGDCTEHGVLAVALLRRLGVPARGVTGWVALEGTFGLHFWVEVRLRDRWVPVDPTFDQAPASALRLKLGTSELSDLGSMGWDSAAVALAGGKWRPEAPWAGALHLEGEFLRWGSRALRLPEGDWRIGEDALRDGAHSLRASVRPAPAALEGARLLQDAASGRKGWWLPAARALYAEVAPRHWVVLQGLQEREAHRALARLEFQAR